MRFTIGSGYDRLSLDSSIAETEKEAMLAEAEKAYLKAIELKPDYFDAYYNLGALFFNKGVEVFEFANSIPRINSKLMKKQKASIWNIGINPCHISKKPANLCPKTYQPYMLLNPCMLV